MIDLMMMVESVIDVKKLISVILIIMLIIQCILNLYCPVREISFIDIKHTTNLPHVNHTMFKIKVQNLKMLKQMKSAFMMVMITMMMVTMR